jgi:hypothetical protein
MKNVIVAVEMPDNELQWKNFLAASGIEPVNKSTAKIAENVWQIDFEKSPTTFARVVHAMKQFGLPGKILPFVDGQKWLPVDSNP